MNKKEFWKERPRRPSNNIYTQCYTWEDVYQVMKERFMEEFIKEINEDGVIKRIFKA
jgi:hypothetical protein